MKAKSIGFIIITLIIGFVLGMLTSAEIRFHKLKPVRVYFSEDRFREGFYKAIQPDEKQKVIIEQVLDKYAKLNSDLQNDFRKDLETNMKEFRKELDSKLTREQISRLREMDEKRQAMIRQNRKSHQNDSLNRRYDRRHDGRFRQGPPPQNDKSGTDSLSR
jgi:recombinational DNA repair protein RecT